MLAGEEESEQQVKPENDASTQIRIKYKYKYTRKDKKYTSTKILTHTNTNFAIGTLENEIYHHLSSRENSCNFWSGNKKKASNVANRRHLTGDKTPLKDGVSQKIFQGGKCIVKIYFLGASSF